MARMPANPRGRHSQCDEEPLGVSPTECRGLYAAGGRCALIPEEFRVTKEVHLTPQDLLSFVVSLGGIKFWAVAIFPMYVGWVLAQPDGSRHLFIDDLRVVLAFVVIGPLLGTFTLLLNTHYDMRDTDAVNPRKQYVRAIEDIIDRETIAYAVWGFGGLGLLLAGFVSANLIAYPGPVAGITAVLGPHVFALLMVATALLSVAYSHPRIRWKGVAGLDLLTNVAGFGILCPLAGWSLLRPVEEFPLWYLLGVALFVGAAYAPTTVSDAKSDREFGIRTLAVRLGAARTMLVGFGCLAVAVTLLFLGGSGGWFPFSGTAAGSLARLWPFLVAQVLLYAAFLRKPSQGKIWALLVMLSILQGLTVLLFLYDFTGGQAYVR
jgi:4-hydroxybenzoate polyprenyltransferase